MEATLKAGTKVVKSETCASQLQEYRIYEIEKILDCDMYKLVGVRHPFNPWVIRKATISDIFTWRIYKEFCK